MLMLLKNDTMSHIHESGIIQGKVESYLKNVLSGYFADHLRNLQNNIRNK